MFASRARDPDSAPVAGAPDNNIPCPVLGDQQGLLWSLDLVAAEEVSLLDQLHAIILRVIFGYITSKPSSLALPESLWVTFRTNSFLAKIGRASFWSLW